MPVMALPLKPPLSPMLAKLADTVPDGDEWSYEPKWDGFRGIVFRDGKKIEIMSRDKRTLERYFPELLVVLAESLPDRCVVDGEIVIPGPDGLEFDALLQRIHPAESRINMLAEKTPSSFVVFDLLALGSKDLMGEPLSSRRAMLEQALDSPKKKGTDATIKEVATTGKNHRRFLTGPWTEDSSEASAWLDTYERIGLDGVVAKRLDSTYEPNKRGWMKVKQHRTCDCVVGGFRLNKTGDGIGSLLLGLYDAKKNLHYVGHTSSFKAQERRDLLARLSKLEGEGGFGMGRSPGGQSRWTGGKDTSWVSIKPEIVCEVGFDRLLGGRFRHAVTFLNWRPDRKPASCTFDQLPDFLRPF
jgi:ATP-dependent DNA ligase